MILMSLEDSVHQHGYLQVQGFGSLPSSPAWFYVRDLADRAGRFIVASSITNIKPMIEIQVQATKGPEGARSKLLESL